MELKKLRQKQRNIDLSITTLQCIIIGSIVALCGIIGTADVWDIPFNTIIIRTAIAIGVMLVSILLIQYLRSHRKNILRKIKCVRNTATN